MAVEKGTGKTRAEEKYIKRKRLLYQVGLGSITNIGYISLGNAIVFPSVMATDMEHFNTTLWGTHITFTDTQLDMCGSVPQLSSLLGLWIAGVVSAKYGRVISMKLFGAFFTISWFGISLLPSPTGILCARFLAGPAMGGFVIAVDAYITELSDNDFRGILFAIASAALMTGELIVVVLGYYLRYYVVTLVCTFVSLAFFIGLFFIPESPTYLCIKGKEEPARKLFLRLRGELVDIDEEMKTCKELNEGSESNATWRGLLQRDVLKKLAVMCFLFMLLPGSGYLSVTVNPSRLFKKSGTSIDEQIATIIMMSIQLVGTSFFFLLDSIGRKRFLMTAFFVMFASLIPLSVHVYLLNQDGYELPDATNLDKYKYETINFHNITYEYETVIVNTHNNITMVHEIITEKPERIKYGWLPVVCLTLYNMGVGLGVDEIPYIIALEYFPTWIRTQAVCVCTIVETVFGFLMLQLYTPMQVAFSTPVLYLFYASVCALAIPYIGFVVKETSCKEVG